MFDSYIKTFEFDNGEIERVQVVTADSFDNPDFFSPTGSPKAFVKIVDLYENFIVPKAPWIFGRMILFYVPDDMKKSLEFPKTDADMTFDTALYAFLKKNVRVKNGRTVYKDERARVICEKLEKAGFFKIVCGKLPYTKLLQVGNTLGFMSECLEEAGVKVNSNFFVMDCFDVAADCDRIGTPIGLMVKNGNVINPPLYDREAFLAYEDGRIEIKGLSLRELTFVTGGIELIPGENAKVFERPGNCRIPIMAKGKFLVIVGKKVEEVRARGGFSVTSAGFVLRVPEATEVHAGDSVTYKGLENVKFGIQVGNSCIINGQETKGFRSRFYDIHKQFGFRVYPPSLYPLDYANARAPRIGFGADKDGKPVIFWAEGPKKSGYVPGEQSRGASLSEMAEIAKKIDLFNAVNLDGGGSAQILINNRRNLTVSDRNPADDSDAERAVPAGIVIQ